MTRAPLLVLLLAGCSNTTGGGLVQVPFQVGGVQRDASRPFQFTTAQGTPVTLDAAAMVAGPFYFNVSAPPTDEFRGGVVILEATAQTYVDLLDPTLHDVPGGADGETGHALYVEIGLLPPDASQSDAVHTQLEGSFAVVSGTATLADGGAVPFAGALTLDASFATATAPLDTLTRVKGASTDLELTTGTKALTLRIDPSHWFDFVAFDKVATLPTDAQGRHTWAAHSVQQSQILEVVKGETGVYAFTAE